MSDPNVLAQIDALLQEDRSFPPPPAFAANAHVRDRSIYDTADRDFEGFWAGFARELEWNTPWSAVLDWQPPHAKWFVGGSLNALSVAFDSVVGTLQAVLPGPLFPAFLVGFVVVLALLFKRLF